MKNVLWESGKKLWNIIVGTFRNIFNVEKDFAKSRYRKCKKCPYIDKSIFGEYCSKCGCLIQSKIKVENEKCIIGKW